MHLTDTLKMLMSFLVLFAVCFSVSESGRLTSQEVTTTTEVYVGQENSIAQSSTGSSGEKHTKGDAQSDEDRSSSEISDEDDDDVDDDDDDDRWPVLCPEQTYYNKKKVRVVLG